MPFTIRLAMHLGNRRLMRGFRVWQCMLSEQERAALEEHFIVQRIFFYRSGDFIEIPDMFLIEIP